MTPTFRRASSLLSTIENGENASEGAKMVELTLPPLQPIPSEKNTALAGTKSLTRSRTLLITPKGQCTPVPETGPSEDLEDAPPTDPDIPSKSMRRRCRGSFMYVVLQVLLWLKDQGKEKKVDASEDVLARYHNLYLYGPVPLTIRVRTAIRSGKLGHMLLCLELAAAVLSLVAYVRSTYTLNPQHWVLTARQICGIFFAADYILKLYSAPIRLYYIVSVTGLVDLGSTLTLLSLRSQFKTDTTIPHMLLVLRALRVLPSLISVGIVGGTITQQIFLLTMYTLGGVFIAAGILQWVEFKATSSKTKTENGCSATGCLSFYDAFYFVVVTLTTVGYGDLTPKSNWGRLVTLLVMLAAVLILPPQINKILQIASRRPYGGKFAIRKAVGSSFVILSGNLSVQTIQHFLSGFYHPCHDKDMAAFPIRVVVMAPFKPSYEMKTLLTHYRSRVEFIEGTPLKETDLDRVGANYASAIFLLADEHAKDFDAEDAAQITRTLSAHRHCGPKVRVIVELLKPENCTSAVWDESEEGIEIICPEAVRFQLLARSCHIKGLSTFVMNLFRSSLQLRRPSPGHWMSQYYHGLRQQIFPVILPSCFSEHGLIFEEAVEIVYLKYEAVLIALDIRLEDELRSVILYPRGRTILPSDIGLVIARDLEIAEEISKYGRKRKASCIVRKFTRPQQEEEGGGVLESVKEHRDVEMGTRKRRNGQQGSVQYQESTHGFGNSLASRDEKSENPSSKVHLVSSLEEAIDMATSWPPRRKWDKPVPPVLERRGKMILENLKSRSMSVVTLTTPHVLVCIEGKWPLNLFYFVSNMRLPFMPKLPLVLLHPNEPRASQWGYVGMFEDVYFVKGSAVYELDLVRAGVMQAEKIIILTQGFEDDFCPPDDAGTPLPSVNTLDVKNILITANIERLINPARDRVLVELQQEIQLQFLRPHVKLEPDLFMPKMLQRDRDSQLLFTPPYVQGKGLCPASFTFLCYATYFNKNTVPILEQLCCGRRSIGDFEDGGDGALIRKLEQIVLPKSYVGLTFKDLFLGLLHKEKMVAVGLYRPAGTLASLVSYVCTNPMFSTELVQGDLVYVLQ